MAWRPLTVALVAAWLACVSTTHAQDAFPELEQAKRLYNEGRFAEAVHELRALLPVIERERNVRARVARLADAYCHLGFAYVALDDPATAKDAFKNVLQLEPSHRLDPGIHSPKVIALFEQARLAVSALEPPLPNSLVPPRLTPHSWNVDLEGGVRTLRRVYLGGVAEPTFFLPGAPGQGKPELFYLLPLRSQAGGSGGSLRTGLAPHGNVHRFELRYAWARASDVTAVPLSVAVTTPPQPLIPPAPDGSEDLRLRWLDALWSRGLTQGRRLSVRLELGYRYVGTRRVTQDLLRENRCTETNSRSFDCEYNPCADDQTSAWCSYGSWFGKTVRVTRRELIRRAARLDDHGLRAGIDLDLRIRGACHLVAHGAMTTTVRRETSAVEWQVQDNPATTTYLSPFSTHYSANARHLAFDLAAGARIELGRRAALRVAYQLDDLGPDGRAAPSERLRVGGLWLTLAYSLGRQPRVSP
jgi:hypothetical protein